MLEPLEGVLAVEDLALVDLAEVALDEAARERGAAEEHRDVRQPEGEQLLQVLAMIRRRLHQEAAHAERAGVDLLHLGHHGLRCRS